MIDWDEAFEEQASAARKSHDNLDPAKIKAKNAEEFARGVRLGWWDADGNPLPQGDDSEDETEDE